MHHHPVGGAPADIEAAADPMDEQLRRTVIAWMLVARPGEQCVLWDLDNRVGVDRPWGLDLARVAEIQTAVTETSSECPELTTEDARVDCQSQRDSGRRASKAARSRSDSSKSSRTLPKPIALAIGYRA